MPEDTELPMPCESWVVRGCVFPYSILSVLDAEEGDVLKRVLTCICVFMSIDKPRSYLNENFKN